MSIYRGNDLSANWKTNTSNRTWEVVTQQTKTLSDKHKIVKDSLGQAQRMGESQNNKPTIVIIKQTQIVYS